VSLLRLAHVTRYFGGLRALNDVSFSLATGEIVGLIGPNGAGKTTLVNCVTGVYRPSRGEIHFDGRRIDGRKPYQISRLGVARTFQIVQPFPAMTAVENVAAGALFAGRATGLSEARERALEFLAFVGLADQAGAPAATLTLAGRKRLELAKSLAMHPRVLIRMLAARWITILIIEHLMKVVTAVCQRVVVLHHGEMIAEGAPADVVADSRVIEAYLGARWAARSREGSA
jgi:branched-chain amino acid transport system ATP-binding protein